jgi:hypothetical protein
VTRILLETSKLFINHPNSVTNYTSLVESLKSQASMVMRPGPIYRTSSKTRRPTSSFRNMNADFSNRQEPRTIFFLIGIGAYLKPHWNDISDKTEAGLVFPLDRLQSRHSCTLGSWTLQSQMRIYTRLAVIRKGDRLFSC